MLYKNINFIFYFILKQTLDIECEISNLFISLAMFFRDNKDTISKYLLTLSDIVVFLRKIQKL